METHPNLTVYLDEEENKCPKCGSERIKKEGFAYTNVAKYQRYSCLDCRGWFRARKNLRKKQK